MNYWKLILLFIFFSSLKLRAQNNSHLNSDFLIDSLPNPINYFSHNFKILDTNYVPSLINSIEKHQMYTASISKALNIGVYYSDLLYCLHNKQYKPSLDYLIVIKKLYADLGQEFLPNETEKRIERNLFNKDSIISILYSNQIRLDSLFYNRIERVYIHLGSNIEASYIYSEHANNEIIENVIIECSYEKNILSIFGELFRTEKGEILDEDMVLKINTLNSLLQKEMSFNNLLTFKQTLKDFRQLIIK